LNILILPLSEGCRWRSLPGDFPAWQTVYTYFRNWRIDGTWVSIHDRLREWVRRQRARGKSLRSDCGQPECKTAAMVAEAVMTQPNRLRRKRHLTVDTLGLVLRVFVSAANVNAKVPNESSSASNACSKVSRVHTVWGGDGTPFLIWVMDVCRWIVQVVLRPEQTKGFVLLKSVGSSSARSAG